MMAHLNLNVYDIAIALLLVVFVIVSAPQFWMFFKEIRAEIATAISDTIKKWKSR